ncbi:MAG: hypothetical protein ACLGHU_14130 [Alphaproteobacteria bacterium]
MAKTPNMITTADLEGADLDAATAAMEAEAAQPAADPMPDPLDHDGDGKKGGSKPGQRIKKGAPLPNSDELGRDPSRLVTVRITVKGDKAIYDGDGGVYDANDEVVLPLGVARLQQEAGRVEIVGSVD